MMTSGTNRFVAGLGWLVIVAFPLWVSCSRIEVAVIPAELAARCVVVGATNPEKDATLWSAWLARHAVGATFHTWDEVGKAISVSLAEDRLLILAGANDVPADVNKELGDYLQAGGRLLALGCEHPLAGVTNSEVQKALGLDLPIITVTGTLINVEGMDGSVEWTARVMNGPYPGPRGTGGDRAGDMRWIPLIEAKRSGGDVMAWPGAMWLTPQANGRYGVAGWLGFDLMRDDARNMLPVMEAVVTAMTREVYVQRFGVPFHSMTAASPQTAVARLVDRRLRDATPLRIAVEWVNERGQEVRRHITAPIDALTGQASINIGLAPNPMVATERYTLRFVVRDRNDQRTLDTAEQSVTIFSSGTSDLVNDPVIVNAGQLMQGRRPVFMLGVNYWPRLSVPLMRDKQHWLNPGRFDLEVIESDLDLMSSAGLNAIAFEYTEIEQAPQVRIILNELRRRSMWACIYVPELNPLDMRLDDAQAMLQAIQLERWPEVFAIEVARGFSVLPKVERQRLDGAWRNWLEENFASVDEAELKLGVSLWRERGNVSGPPDADVRRGPQQERAVALYYCFLRDYISRNLGYIQRWKERAGYRVLITARSAYGWPGDAPPEILDVLDISTGAQHLDVLFPDAWSVHPLRAMPDDGSVLAAYARGAGGGKPLLWSSFGQQVGGNPAAASEQRQKEVFAHYLDTFIKQESSGAFAWWYPPGTAGPVQQDWGLVHPSGEWRPVEESLRAARLQIRQLRMQPRPLVRQPGPAMLSAAQWNDQQRERTGLFVDDPSFASVTEWSPPGTGADTRALLDPRFLSKWTEIDAYNLLNAEWTSVIVGDARQDRLPGAQVRTYTGKAMRAEILNSGAVKWLGSTDRSNGSVWIRVSHPARQEEWLSVTTRERDERYTVDWTPREPGLWEMQAYLVGYGKFGERLQIEVASPPRLF